MLLVIVQVWGHIYDTITDYLMDNVYGNIDIDNLLLSLEIWPEFNSSPALQYHMCKYDIYGIQGSKWSLWISLIASDSDSDSDKVYSTKIYTSTIWGLHEFLRNTNNTIVLIYK